VRKCAIDKNTSPFNERRDIAGVEKHEHKPGVDASVKLPVISNVSF